MIEQDDETKQHVTGLIKDLLPPDTAFTVLTCDGFGKLVSTLAWAGRHDPDVMEGLLREVVVELEEHTLEWLAASAESPTGFLINRVRRANHEQG